ncbi:MAG: SusC/RagA family TonB-linked outer membrane protein, partial [Paramuribaculum sp.]|nr:SusC/RagA family TonB-linked outer membrane protein [Paramuribaculum sp.]
ISILKDAAASSIYGSRAAGGVILVTTKKGKEGKITVNYSDSFRWSSATRMPEMMDSYTWANYMNDAYAANSRVWLTPEKLQQIKDAQSPDYSGPKMFADGNKWGVWMDGNIDLLPIGNTDWLKEHFGKTSFSQEHNISLTGGTDKYNFYFSGNLLGQEGVLVHGDDNQQRYTVNAKFNAKITNWLTFGYSARWYRQQYDAPSFVSENASNELYHNIMRYWPVVPAYDPNGNPVVESFIYGMEKGGRYKKRWEKFDQQFTFRMNPLKGLNINAEFNYRSINNNTDQDVQQAMGFYVDGTPYPQNPNGYPFGAGGTGSRVYAENYRANYFNPNVYGDYAITVNEKNNFKIMAGFQSEWYNYRNFSAQRNGIINGMPYLTTTNGTEIKVGGGEATWSTAGWFGRINYDYDGKYLVEGNIRYDGSSRFRSGSRWTTSPSFSLGWNVARESFMENANRWLNTLKVRYSWGKLGNQNTDSWYPTYTAMGFSPNSSAWLVNNAHQTVSSMPGLVAASLTWEKNRTWDIGLDWGMFNNRFTGTIDYYNRKTIDMVGPGEVLPNVLGASVPNVNNLSMTSRGWELTISWRDRIGEFNYGITANLYDHTVTVDEYPNENKSLSKYYSGRKLGEIWGYTTIGIAKTDAEMDAHLAALDANRKAYLAAHPEEGKWDESMAGKGQNQLGTGWRAGDIMYADLDGNGIISNGEYTLKNHGDASIIGNSTPRYSFGLNLDAQWKGFDLKVFFQGILKRDYSAGGNVFWGACNQNFWQAVGLKAHTDYFRAEDTDSPLGPNVNAYYPRPKFSGANNTATQTRYLQNAAYGRLKNLTIGYTVPQNITRKAYIENLRIFLSGENLFTITDFTKTGDPELIEAYSQAYGYGKVYPISKVFSVGLNVTF